MAGSTMTRYMSKMHRSLNRTRSWHFWCRAHSGTEVVRKDDYGPAIRRIIAVSLRPCRNSPAALQLARIDPAQAIVGATPRLIDEWQEEPKLWDAIRFECDRGCGKPGQFLLTGSATPNDADQPMHSGIGRISRLRMETMTLAELGVSSGAVSLESLLNGCPIKAALGSINGIADIADLLCRGGWPQAVGKTTADAMRISAAYIDGVCESDVSKGRRREA